MGTGRGSLGTEGTWWHLGTRDNGSGDGDAVLGDKGGVFGVVGIWGDQEGSLGSWGSGGTREGSLGSSGSGGTREGSLGSQWHMGTWDKGFGDTDVIPGAVFVDTVALLGDVGGFSGKAEGPRGQSGDTVGTFGDGRVTGEAEDKGAALWGHGEFLRTKGDLGDQGTSPWPGVSPRCPRVPRAPAAAVSFRRVPSWCGTASRSSTSASVCPRPSAGPAAALCSR